MHRRLGVAAVVCLFIVACSSSPYEEGWGADDIVSGGKVDGLLDIAEDLPMGGEVSSNVGGDSVVLYRMRLQRNDRIELAMTVTDGDLNPHITLYYGTASYIGSDTWSRDGDVLRKEYTAESAGTYAVVARAYHGEGQGDFTLSARCLGGPCNGEYPDPVEELDGDDVNDCIREARVCAMDRLPSYDGRVGEVRAQEIFDGCLAEQSTYDGTTCVGVCARTSICQAVVAVLPFYADQSPACSETFTDCMDICYDAGDGYDHYWYDEDEELDNIPEAVCLEGPLGGYCDYFARDHESCGGTEYGPETYAECQALCATTYGAWIDDLDDMCEMDCEHLCEEAIESCQRSCEGSPDEDECTEYCLEDTAYYCM